MNQPYSSALLENAVNEFAKLPGLGRKTALRLVLHLLRQEEFSVDVIIFPTRILAHYAPTPTGTILSFVS